MIRSLCLLTLCSVAVALTGCGEATLETSPVEGLVTVDGKPVPGAIVTFVPVNEGQGRAAYGTADDSGIYRLTASSTPDAQAKAEGGTLPGEYYVSVMKSDADIPKSAEEAHKSGEKYVASAPKALKMKHTVPKKYNEHMKSGLKVTVKEGENNIPLELTSK